MSASNPERGRLPDLVSDIPGVPESLPPKF